MDDGYVIMQRSCTAQLCRKAIFDLLARITFAVWDFDGISMSGLWGGGLRDRTL